MTARCIWSPIGSAPRARGTPAAVTQSSSSFADQPRVRGEHIVAGSLGQADAGSAPRARGTPVQPRRSATAQRISPACAGNTRDVTCSAVTPTDQPRVRGEHSIRHAGVRRVRGSAPRARGTLLPAFQYHAPARISPACAGNTRPLGTPASRPPDQPRVRGEHSAARDASVPSSGSAPRARGTLGQCGPDRLSFRISPACAGNTQFRGSPRTEATDQPRVRGEHPTTVIGASPTGGSAPRARGTRRKRTACGTP